MAPIDADLSVEVYCPADGSLLGPAIVTILQEMPKTELIYDVTTLISLEADLATYQVDHWC